ncbi:MAG: hypothetical protein V3G42_04140 [Oscillospiraceae bacterium]
MKKIISVLLICMTLLSTACLFTGCGGDDTPTDPDVEAYDEWYIRTHDIFGNPR